MREYSIPANLNTSDELDIAIRVHDLKGYGNIVGNASLTLFDENKHSFYLDPLPEYNSESHKRWLFDQHLFPYSKLRSW